MQYGSGSTSQKPSLFPKAGHSFCLPLSPPMPTIVTLEILTLVSRGSFDHQCMIGRMTHGALGSFFAIVALVLIIPFCKVFCYFLSNTIFYLGLLYICHGVECLFGDLLVGYYWPSTSHMFTTIATWKYSIISIAESAIVNINVGFLTGDHFISLIFPPFSFVFFAFSLRFYIGTVIRLFDFLNKT